MTILTNGTNREDKSVIKPKNTNGSKTLTLKSSTCILPELLPLLSSRRKYSPPAPKSLSQQNHTESLDLWDKKPNPIKRMAYALKPPKQQGLDEPQEQIHKIRITLSSKNVKNLEKGSFTHHKVFFLSFIWWIS